MIDGFRVLGPTPASGSAWPRIVAYRLDPETLRVIDIAGGAEEIFGFPREEWSRPEFFLERLHPDDRDAAHAFRRAWARDRKSHELQYRLIDAAGGVRWIHDIREGQGDRGGDEIRGVLVDITLWVDEDPEPAATLRLRMELLRIVTEELGKPVRSISSYADMLGRHLSAQRDDVGGDYAVGVRDGVQRLDRTLGSLLRVAQSGHLSIDDMAERLAAIQATRDGD